MKILIYPVFRNPYQELLYKEISHTVSIIKIEIKPNFKIISLLILQFQVLCNIIFKFRIIHLQWIDFAVKNKYYPLQIFSLLNSIILLIFFKLIGYKLIWTAHNILPHEKQTSNDELITRFVIKFSDKIIVHSENTIEDIVKYGGNRQKCVVIPIGSYDIYKNEISKSNAREKLGIQKNDFVFVFVGLIRKYKGVIELLQTYTELSKKYARVKLIIVGMLYDNDLLEIIEKYKLILKEKLILITEHIPDDDLQIFYNASDIAVFPFQKLTTSSSVLTAFGFHKPIIAPRLGNISDFPNDTGYYYDNNEDLLDKMEEAIHETNVYKKINAVKKYNSSLSWKTAAEKTVKVYKEVLGKDLNEKN